MERAGDQDSILCAFVAVDHIELAALIDQFAFDAVPVEDPAAPVTRNTEFSGNFKCL